MYEAVTKARVGCRLYGGYAAKMGMGDSKAFPVDPAIT